MLYKEANFSTQKNQLTQQLQISLVDFIIFKMIAFFVEFAEVSLSNASKFQVINSSI